VVLHTTVIRASTVGLGASTNWGTVGAVLQAVKNRMNITAAIAFEVDSMFYSHLDSGGTHPERFLQ
jgi:hypothetical protein